MAKFSQELATLFGLIQSYAVALKKAQDSLLQMGEALKKDVLEAVQNQLQGAASSSPVKKASAPRVKPGKEE
jgi:hypothetical protein